MSVTLIGLAILIGAMTYVFRGLPLLIPGFERLPRGASEYLQLVGPAVLAAVAAVNTLLRIDAGGKAVLNPGISWLAVALCVALVAWRGNLFLGILAAVVLAAVARNVGVA